MPNPDGSEPDLRPQPDGARLAVVILTAMNLLNYIDRYVPSAVKELFKVDLQLTDEQTSLPFSSFIIVYMLASPIFGTLADKYSRKWIIAFGVLLWSLATAGAALSTGFISFLVARALVGVGEAAYATIAPAVIADFYPQGRRNRILTIFYVAIPVGAAIGFTLGGVIGEAYGWRAAFVVAGLPGILAAVSILYVKEPRRGYYDSVGPDPDRPQSGKLVAPPWREALPALLRNKAYVWTVAGYTAVTFASGGLAEWAPSWLVRHRGLGLAEAGTLVGTTVVVGGLLGTILGGVLGDWLRTRTRRPYFAVSAGSMALATLFMSLTLIAPTPRLTVACIFATQFFLWFYNGPVNTLLVNSVPAGMRVRAFSLSILSIHLLGDAISPPIMGKVSDVTGNLPMAMWLVPMAMAVGMLAWGYGWRRIPEAAPSA